MYLCRWRANHVIALGVLLVNFQVTAALAINCAAGGEVKGNPGIGCPMEESGYPPASLGEAPAAVAQPPAVQAFQVSLAQAPEDTANSAPLMVLFAALLATWLIRTKSCNSK